MFNSELSFAISPWLLAIPSSFCINFLLKFSSISKSQPLLGTAKLQASVLMLQFSLSTEKLMKKATKRQSFQHHCRHRRWVLVNTDEKCERKENWKRERETNSEAAAVLVIPVLFMLSIIAFYPSQASPLLPCTQSWCCWLNVNNIYEVRRVIKLPLSSKRVDFK